MIKHDGDIIEEFVRHTAQFVDELYIYDNASFDASADILAALQREGFPITVRPCNVLSEGVAWDFNNLIRDTLAATDADYLAVFDVDEFITAQSRSEFEAELNELPPTCHASLSWVTYVPTILDPKGEPRTLARIRHRLAREQARYEKVILARSFLDQEHGTIVGSHAVPAATMPLRSTRLAHFPARSIAQVQAKALLGWSTFLTGGRDETVGAYQWHRLNQKLLSIPTWSEADFLRFSQNYLSLEDVGETPEVEYAPLPTVERRYIFPEQDLQEVSAAFCRQMAASIAHLTSENRRLVTENGALRNASVDHH
jgi:hypothetical protein